MADDASRGTSCNQRQRPCTQVAVALPAGGSLRGRGMVRGEGGVRPQPGRKAALPGAGWHCDGALLGWAVNNEV